MLSCPLERREETLQPGFGAISAKSTPIEEDIMQYCLEMLPDYQTATPAASAAGSGRGDDHSSDNSPATTKATTNNASGSHHN